MPAVARGLEKGRTGSGRRRDRLRSDRRDGRDRRADRRGHRTGVKGLLSFYGSTPSYRPVLDVEGWGDLQTELNAMSKRGEWREMSGLIDDTMVRTIAVVGTPDECAARDRRPVRRRSRSRVCCYFPGYPSTDDDIATLVAAINDHDRSATP